MARTGEDRILTVPNVLSVVRLCCIPVFLWLLFGRENRLGAAVLLGALGATDWVDGFIARRYDQVSNLGKVLDPTADRLLLVVGIVAILVDGSVPPVIAVPAIVREVGVGTAVVVLFALGARRIDVTWWGKCGTFLMMAAFPLFLGGNDPEFGARDFVRALGWACGVVGLVVSYFAAFRYIPLGREALREGRQGRVGSNE
ncbi:MAG: CDP-alcohol phosphatidyltransferase family protein [Actinomycetota bacterium]|nr:CDP-alcohol phosphatidyltransferase family protein [Actinomycetota bacterium]